MEEKSLNLLVPFINYAYLIAVMAYFAKNSFSFGHYFHEKKDCFFALNIMVYLLNESSDVSLKHYFVWIFSCRSCTHRVFLQCEFLYANLKYIFCWISFYMSHTQMVFLLCESFHVSSILLLSWIFSYMFHTHMVLLLCEFFYANLK